jgi:hypothetical protein
MGLKKPCERDEFDFLIFFAKKIKKSNSSRSTSSFSGEKRAPKFPESNHSSNSNIPL